MPIVEKTEDALIETGAWLLLFILAAVAISSYMVAKGISIPESWYPFSIFSNFATWVDGLFPSNSDPSSALTKPIKSSIDSALATAANWIDEKLPRTPSEKAAIAARQAERASQGDAGQDDPLDSSAGAYDDVTITGGSQ